MCPNSQDTLHKMLGPCLADSDCQPGGTCLTNAQGYPGGFCTKGCDLSSDCETGMEGQLSACVRGTDGVKRCMRECLNGFDCGREGYTCLEMASMGGLKICRPSCKDTTCGACTRCDPYSGLCKPLDAPPPTGAEVGGIAENCSTSTSTSSECKSKLCIAARSASGEYSGWNKGLCTATCALPFGWNFTSLFIDDTFPKGNCPAGAICFPEGEPAEQNAGLCLKECHLDADCRQEDGYYCRRTFNRDSRDYTWQNGVCWYVDCLNTSRRCPDGYYCETQTRGSGTSATTVGICHPGTAPGPDAGLPDSGPPDDAQAPDVGVDVQIHDVISPDSNDGA